MNAYARVTRLPDSGANYSCLVTNTVGESEQSDPVYVPGQHELVVSASDAVACIGRPLNLTCKLKSLPANAIYSWEFYRENGNGTAQIFQGSMLTFASLTAHDQGLYFCKVNITNMIYYAEKKYTIAFKTPEIPKLDFQLYFDEYNISYNRLLINCESNDLLVDISRPFRFYKDGAPITIKTYTPNPFLSQGKLSFISSLSTELALYEGNYSCTVVNQVGESQPAYQYINKTDTISVDAGQCAIRDIFQTCPSNSHCAVNKDGVPFCQNDSILDKKDLYIGIGVGLGVGLLIALTVIVTVCVIKCNKKKGVAK